MTIKQFDQFVRQSIAGKDSGTVDWAARREAWLEFLDQLYQLVQGFLEPYIDAGQVNMTYADVVLTEEQIGTYIARSATLFIGNHQVRLQPVGTNLIAARGRVDMVGTYGKVKLVLVPQSASAPEIQVTIGSPRAEGACLGENQQGDAASPCLAWKIATPPPRIRYLPLEKESFLDALMEVANADVETA